MTKPVLAAVSHATRLCGSCSRQASSTPSLIWSHSLSGCPSVTDSEVNISFGEDIKVLLMRVSPYTKKPLRLRRGNAHERCDPSHLPEDAASAGVGTRAAHGNCG